MIVLNYHRLVEEAPADAWTLPAEQFRRHLVLLEDRLIGPQDFLVRRRMPVARQDSRVLLTFDDACLSDYTEVFLKHMGVGSVPGFFCFVPTGFVGRPGRLTWAMIDEMHRHGVAIGSHGRDHVDLTRADVVTLASDLARSKAELEDRLGAPVEDLAFPFGRFSRRVWRAALALGYRRLYTIHLDHHQGFEPFLVSRLCLRHVMGEEASQPISLTRTALAGERGLGVAESVSTASRCGCASLSESDRHDQPTIRGGTGSATGVRSTATSALSPNRPRAPWAAPWRPFHLYRRSDTKLMSCSETSVQSLIYGLPIHCTGAVTPEGCARGGLTVGAVAVEGRPGTYQTAPEELFATAEARP